METSAIVYMVVLLTLLTASGAKRTHILLGLTVPVLPIVWSIIQHPYRLQRLITYLNPVRDPLGSGYQQIRSLEASRSAGFWGQGFTFPVRTLPEIHSDMIFTYLFYTFGWLTGLAVMALAVTLIIRMIRLSTQLKDDYGRLLVMSITGIFGVQFF